jgi:hypothetical protein
MGASAPKQVSDLVGRFERDRKVFLSPDYKEEQLRAEFLNPFFTANVWDMDNKQGWWSFNLVHMDEGGGS